MPAACSAASASGCCCCCLSSQVERLLDRVDAAIYLLDYTKLKTAEEAAVLERLKNINPSLVARLCSRLFFAVNKMDQAGKLPEGCSVWCCWVLVGDWVLLRS